MRDGTDVRCYTADVIGCHGNRPRRTRSSLCMVVPQARMHRNDTIVPLRRSTKTSPCGMGSCNDMQSNTKRSDYHPARVRSPDASGQSGAQQPTAPPYATILCRGLPLRTSPLAGVPAENNYGCQHPQCDCNTVHDSIVMDVHPDEKDTCIKILQHAMPSLPFETIRRYGLTYDTPVGIEIKIGKNWLDLES